MKLRKTLSLLSLFIAALAADGGSVEAMMQDENTGESKSFNTQGRDRVFFKYEKDNFVEDGFGPAYVSILVEQVGWLVDHPKTQAEINGYCDGSEIFDPNNETLSQRRADTVKNFFVKMGIDPSRLSTISHTCDTLNVRIEEQRTAVTVFKEILEED